MKVPKYKQTFSGEKVKKQSK